MRTRRTTVGKVSKLQPAGKLAVPAPPGDLSADAKQLWRDVHAGWELDVSGRLLLSTALRAADRAATARRLVARDGMVVVTNGKGTRAHPALAIIKDADQVLLKAWRLLALDVPPPGPMGRPPGRGPA
jgi:phage terminase small subunit